MYYTMVLGTEVRTVEERTRAQLHRRKGMQRNKIPTKPDTLDSTSWHVALF